MGEFDLSDTQGYQLQVTAGVDANTRVVSYFLRAIDARDGLSPVDPNVGLLQPGESVKVTFFASVNDTSAAGQTDNPRTGDAIEMTARVIIDAAAPVDSLVATATLDAIAPTSSFTVTPIGNDRYQLNWSAVDDAGGSGVAAHSLLVSNDGGTRFRSVLYRTDETSHVYEAGAGVTPTFLVRSIDAAGNVEPVADGILVPRLVADINLGGAAPITFETPPVLPAAVPQATTVADRLFQESSLGIPSRTSATQPSAFARIIRPLAAERFATIPGISGASIGALAMAVAPDGSIYVSGGSGRNQLYRINATTGQPTKLGSANTPIYELVFDAAGQLWASTGGEGLLQLDPTSGAVLDRIGSGISLGLAAIPGQNAIYVATTGGISRLDTATRKLTPLSKVRVDSIAVAADGTLYGTAWPSTGDVLRFDFRGRAEVIARIDGGAESLSIGSSGSLLAGALLVGHQNSGKVSVVDPLSLRQTVVASSGSGRVEGIESLPDGRFLVTQGNQVDIFFTVAAPRVVDTIIRENNRAALVFDVGLNSTDATKAFSATRGANYTLVNKDTGQSVGIGAVQYNAASRTSELLFEALAPAEYELRVASTIESEQGIPIGGNGFTTTFRVFEDVSIGTSVSYSATRINRADGTLLVDVTITNTSDFDIAGPINVYFDALGDDSVIFFGNDGMPAGNNGYQVLSDGTVLAAGMSSLAQTVVIANPTLLDLNFDPRVLATLPPNMRPEFQSLPLRSATASASYEYAAFASDPDGSRVTYVLTDAPDGATVDPVTGEVDWLPTRGASPSTPFELRAYDARGAFERQVWTVDVTGANRAPIIASVDDKFVTEGDLIEVSISGFDPDGDPLFYFADHLPPGAVFDSVAQTLRWRSGGDDAGVYEDVKLIASDGFVETSVSFDIVIANRNVAPTIAPVADRTINEGDAITLRLFGDDQDGDRLRYASPNLPPGAFLDPNTGRFEWTPGFDQHGVFEVLFFADDGTSLARTTSTITVNNINGSVAFPAINEFTIFEGQPLQIRVAATDPEFPFAPTNPLATGEDFFIEFAGLLPNLTYSTSTLPIGATYDAEHRSFLGRPHSTRPEMSRCGDSKSTLPPPTMAMVLARRRAIR